MSLLGKFLSRQEDNEIPEKLTKIFRTWHIEGVATPAFIHNDSYFLVNLEVYRNGLVNCWELVDLDLFKTKLSQGWVVTKVPKGETICVDGLGDWTISEGTWEHSNETYYDYVVSLVKHLNPDMENLHDCHGKTVIKRGTVGEYILSCERGTPFCETEASALYPIVNGSGVSIFCRTQSGEYYLAELDVFSDGTVELTRLPTKIRIGIDALKTMINEGDILTDVPLNRQVNILGIGSFVAVGKRYCVDINDKHLEILDLFNISKGNPGSAQVCEQAFRDYQGNPSDELRDKLKNAYESVPTHLRMFVTSLVREIIYGKQPNSMK